MKELYDKPNRAKIQPTSSRGAFRNSAGGAVTEAIIRAGQG
jgi:hypothetical protein